MTDSEQSKWVAGSIHRKKNAQGLSFCVELACSPHDRMGSLLVLRVPLRLQDLHVKLLEKCECEWLLICVTL